MSSSSSISSSSTFPRLSDEDKPKIKHQWWEIYHDDDGYHQSTSNALNLTLDKAVQTVDAALEARTKLGDDEKWASALTEQLTLELTPAIIKDIKHCGADRHYKRTMAGIIVDYLGAMRKFIIESA